MRKEALRKLKASQTIYMVTPWGSVEQFFLRQVVPCEESFYIDGRMHVIFRSGVEKAEPGQDMSILMNGPDEGSEYTLSRGQALKWGKLKWELVGKAAVAARDAKIAQRESAQTVS